MDIPPSLSNSSFSTASRTDGPQPLNQLADVGQNRVDQSIPLAHQAIQAPRHGAPSTYTPEERRAIMKEAMKSFASAQKAVNDRKAAFLGSLAFMATHK